MTAGDVVLRCGRTYLVAFVEVEHVALVAIISPEEPRHRAHVLAQEWHELAASGLEGFDVVFACERKLREVPRRLYRIGSVSASLVARVRKALAREDQDRRFEDVAGLRSNLLAVTVSAGRRVTSARHA